MLVSNEIAPLEPVPLGDLQKLLVLGAQRVPAATPRCEDEGEAGPFIPSAAEVESVREPIFDFERRIANDERAPAPADAIDGFFRPASDEPGLSPSEQAS